MKVIEMHTTALSLPKELDDGPGIVKNPVIAELKTDDGLEGYGLAYAFNDFQVN
jgi:L-alanine-DL-glutamate epimerase-like enolase superfamily enzyme